MVSDTLTRERIRDALHMNVGLPKEECGKLVEWVFDEITDTLIKGENVKLSSFGSFEVRKKGERVGRNPKTGREVPITERRVVVFRASENLKKSVAEGTTD